MTQKQEIAFKQICEYAEKNNGAMPTLREVANLMKIKHTSMLQHVKQLRLKGYLKPCGKLKFSNEGYKLYILYQLNKIDTTKEKL